MAESGRLQADPFISGARQTAHDYGRKLYVFSCLMRFLCLFDVHSDQ